MINVRILTRLTIAVKFLPVCVAVELTGRQRCANLRRSLLKHGHTLTTVRESETPRMADERNVVLILKEIEKAGGPIGASTLCRSLSCSQATIGRQLSDLEQKGYVKKVGNKGRVLTPDGSSFIHLEDINHHRTKLAKELVTISLDRGVETLFEIIRIRELLEPYAAAEAAECAGERDIFNLENLAFAHRFNLAQGRAGTEENLAFHLEIANISKNRTLRKTLELLLTANKAYVEFSQSGATEHERQVADHFRILDAIRTHNAVAARQAMFEHLEDVAQDVEHSHHGDDLDRHI